MSRYYPPVNESNILLIKTLYTEDKSFFDSVDCPYSEEFKDLFRTKKVDVKESDFDDFDLNGDFGEDYILDQINSLYKYLQEFGREMRTSDTASEKNTYFKLSANLLEKLISMRERVVNLQKMNEFTETVLQILEDEVNVDERSRIIERLKNVTSS